VDNTKEPGPAEKMSSDQNSPANDREKLGEEIMKMLYERTANPSEAFVMLQQMCVMLWEQYKIDWKEQADSRVSESRKQRYLDFISALIDSLQSKLQAE